MDELTKKQLLERRIIKLESYIFEDSNSELKELYEKELAFSREALRNMEAREHEEIKEIKYGSKEVFNSPRT